MTLCFIDLETTGTKPDRHGIIQISGMIRITHLPHTQYLDETTEPKYFNFRCRPFPDDIIEDEALEVNNTTREEIASYPDPQEIYRELKALFKQFCDPYNKTDKMFFMGYKAQFDCDFLQTFWEKNGDQYFYSWFWSAPILDVMQKAGFALMDIRPYMPNFKQFTVARELGIEIDDEKLHDAMYDIEITEKIYRKIVEA